MIAVLLDFLVRSSVSFKPLMHFAICLSKKYLEIKYRKVLNKRGNNLEELHYLKMLRSRIHPPTESYIVDIKLEPDIRLKANICQQYCGDIYYGVGFENTELSFAQKIVGVGDIFFDVGANIGVYTVLASKLVGGSGQVHSFEPLAEVNKLLRANVEKNDCNNVFVNLTAVGDKEGTTKIFVNEQNALSSLGDTRRGKFLKSQDVEIVTLDSYARSANVTKIDFLKIDVEGFEGHVLRGAENLLQRSSDVLILCELAKKNFEPLGFSVDETLSWMRSRGFEVWVLGGIQSLELYPARSNVGEYRFQNILFVRPGTSKYGMLREFFVIEKQNQD